MSSFLLNEQQKNALKAIIEYVENIEYNSFHDFLSENINTNMSRNDVMKLAESHIFSLAVFFKEPDIFQYIDWHYSDELQEWFNKNK